MTKVATESPRRDWRAEHKPAVRHWRHGFFTAFRRNDPVFVIASYLLMSACAGILSGAFGGRGATRITPDESAIVIAVSAALMSGALLAVAIRLPFTSDTSPLSLGGAMFVACVSAVSMTVVVARAGGVLSSAVWLMFGAMLACATVAAVTLPLSFRHSRSLARRDDAESASTPSPT